jgi:glutathione S-transferase
MVTSLARAEAAFDATAGAATLITIPLSHYCEKARWALDRVGFPYREKPHAPVFHRLATMRNGGGSVPMLIHGGCRVLDSTAILLHIDKLCGGNLLYPKDPVLQSEVETLEEYFDTELGRHTRRWAYAELLPHKELLCSLWSHGAPRLEARLVGLVAPLVRNLVQTVYKITAESAQRSLRRVQDVFKEVDRRLSDGRPFLNGISFTAADLTFAALAAPVLFPAHCRAALPCLDDAPVTMRREVLRFRDTLAGIFALRMFEEERCRRPHTRSQGCSEKVSMASRA